MRLRPRPSRSRMAMLQDRHLHMSTLPVATVMVVALAAYRWALMMGSVSFEGQGRSRVMLQNRGRLHLYAEPGSGRLLGMEAVGPRIEHLAHLVAWSHQQQLTVQQMLSMPFYHPVVEEGLRTALRSARDQL